MVRKTIKVAVAMSGGVDSSVAAALLLKKGYEVIGVTMDFDLSRLHGGKLSCCGARSIDDAKNVASMLGIRHYVFDMHAALKKMVINDFCYEYAHGRTPNPCVRCNQFIKFGSLLKRALSLGADYLATGHYARISRTPNSNGSTPLTIGPERSRRARLQTPNLFLLRKAIDRNKDQSYFLYRLSQNQIKHILFPNGDLTKLAVRELARRLKFPVAQKPGSQEICFLPDNDYRGFLRTYFKTSMEPGLIKDTQGNIFGYHKGIAFYTIGQRQGLGIARGYPVYIIKIDKGKNEIIIGPKEEAYASRFLVKDAHFVTQPLKKKVALKVRIRYNHKEAPALVIPRAGKAEVKFKKPQFAITPGQSAVFYDKDIVVGGGIIEKII